MLLKDVNRRKFSSHLLAVAEKDEWKTTLYILLQYSTKINLNARTESGDYLIHLAAFASCEQYQDRPSSSSSRHYSSKLETQKYALACMKIILERDFTAINKVASDGGTALHCALAAAASLQDLYTQNFNDCSDRDSCGHGDSDNESCESGDEDDDDDDNNDDYANNHINKDLITKITLEGEQAISLEEHCSELLPLSNQEVILTSIKLLLEHDADPNIPLINLFDLILDEADDKEVIQELAYAREAVVQQWKPLMFVLDWFIRAATVYHCNLDCLAVGQSQAKLLALPIVLISLLINSGADATSIYATAPKKYKLECTSLFDTFGTHHM